MERYVSFDKRLVVCGECRRRIERVVPTYKFTTITERAALHLRPNLSYMAACDLCVMEAEALASPAFVR